MDISPQHEAAVIAACRLPALYARLALLAGDPAEPERAAIAFYGTAYPDPAGAAPGADPIVTLPLTWAAGTVDEVLFQILIVTPLEAQVTGADPDDGTIPQWARVTMPDGTWWADLTVSVEGEGGEIQLVQTGTEGDPAVPVARLFNGAFARIASAVIQG